LKGTAFRPSIINAKGFAALAPEVVWLMYELKLVPFIPLGSVAGQTAQEYLSLIAYARTWR
jgi:hypothetical protein